MDYELLVIFSLAICLALLHGFPSFNLIPKSNFEQAKKASAESKNSKIENYEPLGLTVRDIDLATKRKLHLKSRSGALILRVLPDSVAERAGLQTNDIIHQINKTPIQSRSDYSRMMREIAMKPTVEISIERRGLQLNVSVSLASDNHGV